MKQKEASLKKGFTLAEVLITLGIIGVIAAITIPAVISSSSQEQYVTGVKKAYNTLKAIEREAKLEHGDIENWTIGSDQKASFDTYFRPYMDILKDCGTAAAGCFGASKYLNDTTLAAPSGESYYKVVTSDGIAYGILLQRGGTSWIYVDINGIKGPNKLGRDLFEFQLTIANGIKPRGFENTSADSGCNITGQGLTCAARVLSEGAMNY